jgi:replicative DNA helicase
MESPLDDLHVKKAGIMAVEQWLLEKGYEDIEEHEIDGEVEKITAKKDGRTLVVGVRSSFYPEDPGFLSIEQKQSLITNAMSSGGKARLARVWLNKDLTLKDKYVMWSKL